MKCCKCSKRAINILTIDGKNYHVCKDHTPNPLPPNASIQTFEESLIQKLRRNNHIAKLQGKEYVLFGGLLWIAHENGLNSIQTQIIEHDRESKFCIVQATVKGRRGTFTGYGDADPKTCGKKVADAYIRMSETRAVARALRFYTGIGMTAKEELPPQQKS